MLEIILTLKLSLKDTKKDIAILEEMLKILRLSRDLII